MAPELDVVVREPATLAEGPLWDAGRDCLWWVDIDAGRLHRFDPADGTDEVTEVGVAVGAVALREDGGLILAAGLGFATYDGELSWLGTVDRGVRMNDGKCDPAGRFLAGTMVDESHSGSAAFYRLDRGRISLLFGDVTISNGLGWSPDGETLYYIDTPRNAVWAFDYDVASGAVSRQRTFVDLRDYVGRPDGMAVAADGAIWVAMSRGGAAVHEFTPDGRPGRVVSIPTPFVTSVAFGGADRSDLYITTARRALSGEPDPLAGCVFRARGLDTAGLPVAPYRY
jgi:sugar lactone lactonase YvrE